MFGINDWGGRLFDDRGDITLECISRFANLDKKDLFYWYKAYYSKLSEMVSYLRHIGYDLFLLHGRLINSVRDLGHNIHFDDMFSAFGVIDEGEWNIESFRCHKLWDSVNEFINNDSILDMYWTRGVEIPAGGQNTQLIYTGSMSGGTMLWNLMVKDFPGFPFQRFEIQRYYSVTEEQLKIVPKLRGRVSPFLCAYGDWESTLGERYRYSLDLQWLNKRSRVYLYESPFWTIDKDYIETFLFQKYGEGWRIPVDVLGNVCK